MWKTNYQSQLELAKLNIHLPYNPFIIPFGVYPEKWKSMFAPKPTHRRSPQLCFIHNHPNLKATKMFFNRCWMNILWFMQRVEYYLVVKNRNELSRFEKA